MISLVSYLFTGSEDQSLVEGNVEALRDSAREAENWAGFLGAYTSHYLIFKGLGYSMLLVPIWLFNFGYHLIFKRI